MKIKHLLCILLLLLLLLCLLYLLSLIKYKEPFYSNKQHNFKECLNDMRMVLHKNNTDFFLCWGTLLGQYRENKFIEHDHDIDIGILYNNFDISLKDIIIESGLFKFRHEFGELDKSYECTFIHKKTNISIDIFIFYHIKKDLYYTSTHTGKCNKTKYGFCKWGRHLKGFKEIDFIGNKYKVPKNTEDYLEESYGKDWRIPKKFNYYQGLNKGHYKNLLD